MALGGGVAVACGAPRQEHDIHWAGLQCKARPQASITTVKLWPASQISRLMSSSKLFPKFLWLHQWQNTCGCVLYHSTLILPWAPLAIQLLDVFVVLLQLLTSTQSIHLCEFVSPLSCHSETASTQMFYSLLLPDWGTGAYSLQEMAVYRKSAFVEMMLP